MIEDGITFFTPAICYEGIALHNYAFPLACAQCTQDITQTQPHIAMLISEDGTEHPCFNDVLFGGKTFSFAHTQCWLKRALTHMRGQEKRGVLSWKVFHRPKQANTWPFTAKAYSFDKETTINIVSVVYAPIHRILRLSRLTRLPRNGNPEPEALEIWL